MIISLDQEEIKVYEVLSSFGVSDAVIILHLLETSNTEIEEIDETENELSEDDQA